ncbi:MAG: alkaline phosphatase family protein [Candidatus Riflebacteria bacterium]|nr:alkaline phosphatase family protein [Candidatus Riflebacteria bacterium]
MTLVDAWRWDLCLPDLTPTLAGLRSRGAGGVLTEPFGFNTGPAIFAGIYPEISNQIQKFWLVSWIHGRAAADLCSRGVTTAAHLVDFEGVPHGLQRFFNLVETRNHFEPGCVPAATIFDVLRAHARRFLWIGVPDDALLVSTNLRALASRFLGDEDLVFIHWSEPDWLGHEHGPGSTEYRGKLREIDGAIGQVVERLRATGHPVAVLAFGDHGMVEVTGALDLTAALATLPVRCPRDFVYFLDSTAARFWFFTDRARREVEGLLATLPMGRAITDEDRRRYRLPLGDRRHWDLCWMLDEGWVVAPDFFHSDPARRVKGMHGYRPEVPGNQAAWVAGGDLAATGTPGEPARPMVDLAPTALAILGLPVPSTCQGRSLLAGSR